MQEAKNKRRLILLVVLLAATVLLFWWVQPENRIAVDPGIFQVDDLRSISRVELVSDTSSVNLLFNGSAWQVNGNKADGNMINVLFATLQQARPRREVSLARRDSIYRQLEDSGVTVLLYAGQELKKKFLAGGNAAKTQAYFASPQSKDVYVMAIPGYRVYVAGIFELRESGWWEKLVFDFNWVNFKSLETHFPANPSGDFKVSRGDNNLFTVEGLPATDTTKLHNFLDDLSLLTVDEYVPEPGLKDSLRHATPSMRILVSDVADRTYRLNLYGGEAASPVSGLIQDEKVAIFSRRKIKPLLKSKSYFRKK